MGGTADSLRIGGFHPFSTADWPGRMVAVLFLRGCPLACRYCHNPHLRDPAPGADDIAWPKVLAVLKRRVGLLDGVVLSGGEPTMQSGAADALRTIRSLGFAAGLHTAGPSPDRLTRLLPLLDWVGFDLKAPAHAYGPITNVPAAGPRALESLNRVAASGVPFEVRLTVHPALTGPKEVAAVAATAADAGAKVFALQAAGPQPGADPTLPPSTVSDPPTLPATLTARFDRVIYRAA